MRTRPRAGTIISPAPPFYRSAVVNDVADFLEPRKEDREKDDADEERIGSGIVRGNRLAEEAIPGDFEAVEHREIQRQLSHGVGQPVRNEQKSADRQD